MKHQQCSWVLTFLFCLLPHMTAAQVEQPKGADTAKECSICHYRWVSTFFTEHRKTPLTQLQEDPVVGTQAMCLSCHDGSVRDSRDKICNDPGHQVGNIPSDLVSIPDTFPLDDNGAMQCSTCHTPHAVKARKDTLVSFFLRAPNDNSALCKRCHVKNTGGSAAGNHPTEVSAEKAYAAIVEAGGLFGTGKPHEIICETCHTPHGGVNNRRLVLSIEDPLTRSVLCEVCHTQQPGLSEDPTLNHSAHPIDLLPGTAVHIPHEWTNGDPVFLGTGGELVCRTCHKPHYAADKKHLLAERSADGSLCVQCHQEQSRIIASSHDLRKSVPEEKNILNQQAQDLGPCTPCHLVHEGVGNFMWARTLPEDSMDPVALCASCHASGQCADESLPGDFSHPIDIPLTENTPPIELPLFDARGKRNAQGTMSCSTCHDVHNPHPLPAHISAGGKQKEMFLRTEPDQDPSTICVQCHREQAQVVKTKHDLKETETHFTNALGKTADQTGLCSPCHVPHRAVTQRYLWAGTGGESNPEHPNTGSNTNTPLTVMMCTGCHAEGNSGRTMPPERAYHPSGLVFPAGSQDTLWKQFPLFDTSGAPGSQGALLCSTCHNPHQWGQSSEGEPFDITAEGTIVNSFLRHDTDTLFCAACHGEVSLLKFLYFHRSNSRKKPSFPELLRKR